MATPPKKQPSSAAECKNNAQMAAAASQKASANTDPECLKCAEEAELQAVILYPALGTPYVAPASEKKIRLFLIVEGKCVKDFGICGAEAPHAWYYINTHLRIIPFKEASKTSADLKGTKLYSSLGAAKEGIKVWYKGVYGSEPANGKGLGWKQRLIDHEGRIVANLRESAINLFVANTLGDGSRLTPAFPSKEQGHNADNNSLCHLFEIEIGFAGLRLPAQPDTMYTLAWMVTCVYKKEAGAFKSAVSHWEHQDKLVYDFFHQMKKARRHFAEPFAFELEKLKPDVWPTQMQDERHRIKPFHPVIFKSGKSRLDLGHISDIHVSSRQFALARSDAQIIEGLGKPLGSKVVNCIASCKDIFDQFQSGPNKADALFITGDLLDFNRNLDPAFVPGKTPLEQWPWYNLAGCLDAKDETTNRAYYPRGLDDMLMYSLIRRAYENNLPVFMTTGNHEAYDEPFGISPRVNTYAAKLSANPSERAFLKKGNIREFAAKDVLDSSRAFQPTGELTDHDPNDAKGMKLGWLGDQGASKANEGIPADHNLTIYEACLIYGPTFAQVMQSWNYMSDNYDWFFTLFTPLADFAVEFNDQTMVGLEWGNKERMLEMGTYKPHGLLPRSVEAISEPQDMLLSNLIARDRRPRVFSHFTVLNYGQKKGYVEKANIELDKQDLHLTAGSFELRRSMLFDWVLERKIEGVHSGHSHRSGGYRITEGSKTLLRRRTVDIRAHAPEKQTLDRSAQLWVTSCAGGIGTQSLCGELQGWNLMPPSGSLIDGATGTIKTVPTRGVKPRFCVGLDYLQCHEGKDVAAWITRYESMNDSTTLLMVINHIAFAKPFIKGVTFHVWDKRNEGFSSQPMSVAHESTSRSGTLIYRCQVADLRAFLKSLAASPMVFAQLDFNDALVSVTEPNTGAKLYNQFDFDDSWVFRVTSGHGVVAVRFHPNGEYPDWGWLSNTRPDRYPAPKSITDTRTPGR